MRFNTLSQASIVLTKNNRLIASLILAASASTSFAADYSAGATMNVEASHNDNLRMVERDKTQVYKYQATPAFTFSANTETSSVELHSTFDFNRYDKSQFNSDDQNIALKLSRRFENSSVSLDAKLVRDSTITSELLTSGVIGTKAERTEQYLLAPSWLYTLNENNLVQLSGNYTIQDYHTDAYTGYKNYTAGLDWIHIINERVKFVTSITYSDYHSDDILFNVPNVEFSTIDFATGVVTRYEVGHFGQQGYSTRTKDKGIQLGFDYQWSEQSLLQARIGRSKSDTTYPIKDPKDTCANPEYLKLLAQGFRPYVGGICSIPGQNDQLSTAQLDWTWTNERQEFNLNTTKSTQPTSNGYTVDALQVGSNWRYELTELDQISTNISLVRNRASSGKNAPQNSSLADRDYGAATIQYRHQIGTNWFISTSYQYSRNKYSDIDYQADSKTISVGVFYRPQQWHWSR